MPTCDRCRKPATTTTTSYFNTQIICLDCEAEERAHPDFAYAQEVEEQACRGGNYNFKGVGWPGRDGRVVR